MRKLTTLPFNRLFRALHAGEEGMLSLASLFVILGFLVLIGLLVNAGLVTGRKLETQNTADSAAYAAGIEMARGMNSVTAINHLIGELTAVVIMVHTLGGDELDNGKQPSTPQSLQGPLNTSYEIASGLPGEIPVYDPAYTEASKDSQVGGAIYDARMRLKQVLTWAFEAHAIGAGLTDAVDTPIIGPILELDGLAISGAALAFELKVYQECETLDMLEEAAQTLNPLKKLIRDLFIPMLYGYGETIVETTPIQAMQAVSKMGEPNQADCALFPSLLSFPLLELPVQKEPQQPNSPVKSQLMRATTPWVQWWRQAWMDFGKRALILSRFACAVEDRSTQYTASIVKSLREDKSIQLYILKDLDLNSSDKTHEKWMSDSSEADKLFTVVGLAHRTAPPVASPVVSGGGIFRQENPDGFVCYAQAMFYNANPQTPGSGGNGTQPTAGWDTLNWSNQVPEYRTDHSDDAGTTPNTPQPLIQLNWQCKLVPTTRLTDATPFQTGPIGSVLLRNIITSESPLARTH